MKTDYQSHGGRLSKLWIMFNQLNEEIELKDKLLSPYSEDGKDCIYETVFLFDKQLKLRGYTSPQAEFLDKLTTDIKFVIGDFPVTEIKKWFWHEPEEFIRRERCRVLMRQAHSDAPLVV